MDPSKRNATALHQHVDQLALDLMLHTSNIFASAKEDGAAPHYSTTAHKELSIKEESTALVRAAQDLTTLVRDLQELWLFGRLDTVRDGRGEEAVRERVGEIAGLVGGLVGRGGGGEAK